MTHRQRQKAFPSNENDVHTFDPQFFSLGEETEIALAESMRLH
jgi:hypothetical protein